MRKPTAILAALGLTVGLTSLSLPAHADVPCQITNFSPRVVVIGLSPVPVRFKPIVSDCAEVTGWSIDNGHGPDYGFYVDDTDPEADWEAYYNYWTARQTVGVTVSNGDNEERTRVFKDAFQLKRRTAWKTFNASPEPVTRGRVITLKSRLVRADWDKNKYIGYTDKSVAVQFLAAGTSDYVTVKTVKTGSYGNLRTTVTARKDGRWRLRYAGGGVAGPATSTTDYVDVR